MQIGPGGVGRRAKATRRARSPFLIDLAGDGSNLGLGRGVVQVADALAGGRQASALVGLGLGGASPGELIGGRSRNSARPSPTRA